MACGGCAGLVATISTGVAETSTAIDNWHNRVGPVGQADAVRRQENADKKGTKVKEFFHARGKAAADVPASTAAAGYQAVKAAVMTPVDLGKAAFHGATGDKDKARSEATEAGYYALRPWAQLAVAITSIGAIIAPGLVSAYTECLQRSTTNMGNPEKTTARIDRHVGDNKTATWDDNKLKTIITRK